MALVRQVIGGLTSMTSTFLRAALAATRTIGFGMVLAPAIASAAPVNVTNWSFEDPQIAVAGDGLVTIVGWEKSGTVQLVRPALGPPLNTFSGQDGPQAVFTGNGSVTQALIPIVPGASYTLSAYVSLLGFPAAAGGNYTMTVGYEPNNTLGSFTAFATATNLQGPLGSSWLFASITGVAPLNASGALAIRLGGDGEFWDSVSVSANSTPLPATWLMLLGGLAGFGTLANAAKRKRQHSHIADCCQR
jgi:hypothetical protein